MADSNPADQSGAGGPTAAEHTTTGEQSVPDDAVLVAEDLESGYGDLQVLHGLSMHLRSEEIVCIIGPNGAGKSTVLKTMFGLLDPWSGTVRFDGQDITGNAPEEIVRLGMGYVPQIDNVFPGMTVKENLLMGGVASEDTTETMAELRDRFSLLDDKWSTTARNLSGGQRQILALARALMTDPDVLLVDEPSAGLAPSIVDDVIAELETVNEFGTAVLMIEQNAREGLAVADRGYVLAQGQVEFTGDADEILDNERIRELYLGG